MSEKQQLSLFGKRMIGAGIAILLIWGIVNYIPSTVAVFATTETGKVLLFWLHVILILGSIIAIIVMSVILAPTRKFNIEKVKIGPVEVTVSKEIDLDGKD